MPKFRISWSEDVSQFWYVDVEAETAEEAEKLFYDGEHINGDEVLEDSYMNDNEFTSVEKLEEPDPNQLNMFE